MSSSQLIDLVNTTNNIVFENLKKLNSQIYKLNKIQINNEDNEYDLLSCKLNIYFTSLIEQMKFKFISAIEEYKKEINQNQQDILNLIMENMLLKIENQNLHNIIKKQKSSENNINNELIDLTMQKEKNNINKIINQNIKNNHQHNHQSSLQNFNFHSILKYENTNTEEDNRKNKKRNDRNKSCYSHKNSNCNQNLYNSIRNKLYNSQGNIIHKNKNSFSVNDFNKINNIFSISKYNISVKKHVGGINNYKFKRYENNNSINFKKKRYLEKAEDNVIHYTEPNNITEENKMNSINKINKIKEEMNEILNKKKSKLKINNSENNMKNEFFSKMPLRNNNYNLLKKKNYVNSNSKNKYKQNKTPTNLKKNICINFSENLNGDNNKQPLYKIISNNNNNNINNNRSSAKTIKTYKTSKTTNTNNTGCSSKKNIMSQKITLNKGNNNFYNYYNDNINSNISYNLGNNRNNMSRNYYNANYFSSSNNTNNVDKMHINNNTKSRSNLSEFLIGYKNKDNKKVDISVDVKEVGSKNKQENIKKIGLYEGTNKNETPTFN